MKIAQVILSNSWGDVSPAAFERGIGGREGALVRLAKEWAKLGHDVTNFVPTQKAVRFDEHTPSKAVEGKWQFELNGFHEYVPANMAKHMFKTFPYDAIVAWECPQVFADDDIIEKQPVRLVHMQVAHLENADDARKYATGIVALSEWAKDFLIHSGSGHDNMYVRPNGVDIASYPLVKKNPNGIKAVYSSSPDRGLWHLLKMWPDIRSIDKKASLLVAYGARGFTDQMRWAHSRIGQMSLEIEELLDQPGVTDVGKIGQKDLSKLQLQSNFWLYPCDSIQATETGCITAIENMAAGNACIMSDADCLESEFKEVADIIPLPFDSDKYIESLSLALSVPHDINRLVRKSRAFAESRDWSKIAPTWIDLFRGDHA
jgi:hypothetical protein